jgi:hypothetical protein|tara:strand:+ start:426 stop:608 length:183 start_codon:yes stop_codon:yes gene_type:complete
MKQIRMWVAPKFKKKLKKKAAEEEMSILELTEEMSRESFDDLENTNIKAKKRRVKFGINI